MFGPRTPPSKAKSPRRSVGRSASGKKLSAANRVDVPSSSPRRRDPNRELFGFDAIARHYSASEKKRSYGISWLVVCAGILAFIAAYGIGANDVKAPRGDAGSRGAAATGRRWHSLVTSRGTVAGAVTNPSEGTGRGKSDGWSRRRRGRDVDSP